MALTSSRNSGRLPSTRSYRRSSRRSLIAAIHSHPCAEIRFTVACALGSFPNDLLSVRTLLTLMDDADADVRDWSTFGLGVLGDQDATEIREALCQRLHDEDVDAREEALVGLAKRHDMRILPQLIHELEQPSISSRNSSTIRVR